MDKNNGILHLSDLHIVSFNGNKLYKSRTETENFIECFFDNLIEIKKDINICKIIISGDLTNRCTPRELKEVEKFLVTLLETCQLQKEDLIVVPGNHDINWSECECEYENKIVDDKSLLASTLHEVKFKKFSDFYRENIEAEIDVKSAIWCKKFVSEINTLFIGINTINKESHLKDDHYGSVDYTSLKENLENLSKEFNFNNIVKIAVFHHPPDYGTGESNASIRNWKMIKELFVKYNINIFSHGHQHLSRVDVVEGKTYIGCGTFALIDSDISNEFLIYKFQPENESMKIDSYRFTPCLVGKFGIGEWVKTENNKLITLLEKKDKEVKENNSIDLVNENPLEQDSNFEDAYIYDINEEISGSDDNIGDYSDILVELVKHEKIYATGHFHWGNNLKAHGWINTNLLLSKQKNLKICIKALLEIINKKEIKADIVIGLGMEGNILGSMIAISLGKKFTYISLRNESEYEVAISNIDCENVLFVSDTTFSGNTIRETLERYKDYFTNKKEITLLSLFCTGDLQNIRNQNSNVKFYSACNEIKVNECKQNKEECAVNKYNLSIINEF